MDRLRSRIITDHPIGNGLDAFRASSTAACKDPKDRDVSDALDHIGPQDLRSLALSLLFTLQALPAAALLPSNTGSSPLQGDLLRLISAFASEEFDLGRVRPLLATVLAGKPDAEIWERAYHAATQPTPPPRPAASSSLQQTPWLRNTSSFANSSERRRHVDDVLREELGTLYVGLRGFHEAYFGGVPDLETASAVFLDRCQQQCSDGAPPLFSRDGWRCWPRDANQDGVLTWFANVVEELAAFARAHNSTSDLPRRRRPLALPARPVQGSTAERKLDVGLVDDPAAGRNSRCHWSQILVPGELKSNPSADALSKAWLDLGRYAREVLAAQDTRRFVLGFTLCGPLMRVWEFDRLGGVASDWFDVNKDGLRFVSTMLGFLWMDKEQLGFDPTVTIESPGGRRHLDIWRNGRSERLVIDTVMRRAPCVAGRATTCWKVHRKGVSSSSSSQSGLSPLVVKDSWQFVERGQEGDLLREATERGVVNVARYYHHETVRVSGADDDIRGSVRRGLDITTAENYGLGRSSRTATNATSSSRGLGVPPRTDGGGSAAGSKRSSSQTGASLPASKRSRSASPTGATGSPPLQNRVHRRVVLCDFGKPIYKASTRAVLLRGIEGCVEGHESLRAAGILHRDISVNNLMVNEDDGNPSWAAFLIDLDLAVEERREGASGARGRTGTRAFMAIGALLGQQHSFMHDLESFFWVLFWICVHYDGPGAGVGPTEFESWNYERDDRLAGSKKGLISDEEDFVQIIQASFTPYYQPLVPWVNRLRRRVFPGGERWKREDPGLYSDMRSILSQAAREME